MENAGGWIITIALHVAIIAAILVGHAHRAESIAIPRDFMVAARSQKHGKTRACLRIRAVERDRPSSQRFG